MTNEKVLYIKFCLLNEAQEFQAAIEILESLYKNTNKEEYKGRIKELKDITEQNEKKNKNFFKKMFRNES